MSEMASAAPAPDDGQRSGIVHRIGRKHHGDDLRFATEAFREERSYRTVNQPAGQDFLFGGTALTLDETARDTCRRRRCTRGNLP